MGLFQGLLHSYEQYNYANLLQALTLSSIATMLILALMEGLLGSDNALVLAVKVNHLPKHQRKKALFYGMWGAYLFRIIAIGLGTYLLSFWWIKILAGLYLFWLVIKYFIDKSTPDEDGDGTPDGLQKGFIGTIITVELLDIAFSIDSVAAAFGFSSNPWVLLIGAMLGILMMRGVSTLFLKLIAAVPELETTAYILIGIIAVRMVGEHWGIDFSNSLFFIFLLIVFGSTFAIHYVHGRQTAAE